MFVSIIASAAAALLLKSFAGPALAIVARTPHPHPTRTRILAHLRRLPGDHLRSIARSVQVSLGEARYHLHVLHRSGAVQEEKTSHRSRYYPLDSAQQAEWNLLYRRHWEHREVRTRVLSAVRAEGSLRPAEVARRIGISRQLATYHLDRLIRSGAVAREGSRYRAAEYAAAPDELPGRLRP